MDHNLPIWYERNPALQASILPPLESNDPEQVARHTAAVVCLSKLPPFHPAALKLLNISGESGTAIADFEAVFRTDPALTADLLLVANSALFGTRAKIASIRHALTHMGLERVRSLASTIALGFFVRNQPRNGYVRHIWAHSIATAVIAEALGRIYKTTDLYTAGLTHDLGRLGLLLTVGPNYEKEMAGEFSSIEESSQVEQAKFLMDHCFAGALVGHKWGFPVILRSCMVAHHGHDPGAPNDPLVLVQLACRMADALGFPEIHYKQLPPAPELPDILRRSAHVTPEFLQARISEQLEAIDR